MHLRYPRAAVDHGAQADGEKGRCLPLEPGWAPTITLWAAKPLQVATGRVVAVRMNSAGRVLVRLVDSRTQQARWLPANTVLTQRQASAWVQTTRFYR